MKILVLGTSHAGTVRMAHDTIAARFPTLELSYFGLPGGEFGNAVMDGSCFVAPESAREVSQDWNGCLSTDLAAVDHVFLVGERFGHETVLRLLLWHDTLEEGARREFPVMSRAAMTALIESAVSVRVGSINRRLGGHAPLTVTPAPYPLLRSWRPGKGHERKIKELVERAHIDDWIEVYETTIATQMAQAGLGFVPQPLETRHDCLRTLNRFARAPLPKSPEKPVDNRHMNAEFGALLFEDFAREILDIHPAAVQKSEDAAGG